MNCSVPDHAPLLPAFRSSVSLRADFLSLLTLFIILCLAFPASAETTLVVEGVAGELEQNILLLVANPPDRTETRKFRRYLDALPAQVVSALSAYGYYAAEATVSVDEVARSAPRIDARELANRIGSTLSGQDRNAATGPLSPTVTQLTINVTPNAPITIGNVSVRWRIYPQTTSISTRPSPR